MRFFTKSPILISLLFLFFIKFPFSGTDKDDILKSADLLLDMLEYDTAIQYYKKALSLDPNTMEVRKNIAYAYFQLGKNEEAMKYLKEEITLFPEDGDAYDLLVYVLFKLNKIEEAYDLFEKYNLKIVKSDQTEQTPPNIGLGDLVLGVHFKNKGNFDKAKKYFMRAHDRGFNPIKCYVQLIDVELIQDKLEIANTLLFRATNLYGFQPEFYFLYGILGLEKSKVYFPEKSAFYFTVLRNISIHFKKAISIRPNFKEALFNLAAISYNFNDYKRASEYFERTLKLEPENERIKFYLDCSLKRLNKSKDKDSFSEKCPKNLVLIKDFIDKPDLEYKYQYKNDILFILQNINNLAIEFIRKGKLHEGIKRFQNGLKIYEGSPEINHNLGMCYFLLGSLKESEKYAIISTKSKVFYKPKVRKELRKFKNEEKKELSNEFISPKSWTFEDAIQRGNYFLEAYDLLGNIYFKMKDFYKSIEAFKKVIEIDSQDSMGYYNLGCSYYALKEYDEAEKNWRKAIRYDRRKKEKAEDIKEDQKGEIIRVSVLVLKRTVSFHSYKSLGSLYEEKGNTKKAIVSYRKAIEIFPTDSDCYYELGKLYLKEGDKQNAIKYLKKYLEYGTEKEKEVKELLKKLRKNIQ
ncbi:MAG: tetratricopeptide repeat protein [Acidobacteriota bacterium]